MTLAIIVSTIWSVLIVGFVAYKLGYLRGDEKGWDRCFAAYAKEREMLSKRRAAEASRATKANPTPGVLTFSGVLSDADMEKFLKNFEHGVGIEPPKPKYTKQQILKKFST